MTAFEPEPAEVGQGSLRPARAKEYSREDLHNFRTQVTPTYKSCNNLLRKSMQGKKLSDLHIGSSNPVSRQEWSWDGFWNIPIQSFLIINLH